MSAAHDSACLIAAPVEASGHTDSPRGTGTQTATNATMTSTTKHDKSEKNARPNATTNMTMNRRREALPGDAQKTVP
jgi:hypothetical protein